VPWGWNVASLGRAARVVGLNSHQRDALEPMSREELRRRMGEGAVTVLDLRPVKQFEAGHIEGAINIPIKDLERRLAEVGRRREIVAYCRGPYCVMAYEAVERLRARGFTARRLVNGYPEWRLGWLRPETTGRSSPRASRSGNQNSSRAR
jgi:ArsR family transcriptional regulator